MSKINDREWMEKVTMHYKWPEHSLHLRSRILSQERPRQTKRSRNYFSVFQNLFSYNWQPVGAMAMTLLLGVFVGSLILTSTETNAQTSIYTDSDYNFAQSIVAAY